MIDVYPVQALIRLISWEHFFYTWHVKSGTEESARLRTEAEQFLNEWEDRISVRFLYQGFEAHSEDDDIVMGDKRIPFLRQQIPNSEGYCLCMSDFVHANHDEVYVFATSVQQPPSQDLDDPYSSLLSQTISDRLAEAAAEKLQMQLVEEGRLSGHQVIRPAVGYPMIPDMSINFLLNELCDMSRIGIQLTENGMMHPHASVSGFMIANPHACYFTVGPISEEQLTDYARRRGYTIERMRKFINAL